MTSANERAAEEDKEVLFRASQRSRSVDQLKRLYAVLMGFATTACVNNAYNTAKLMSFSASVWPTIFGQVVVFIAMIIPTYFVAEYYLDYKYIRKSGSHFELHDVCFDLLALIPISCLYLALSQSFPVDGLRAFANGGNVSPLVLNQKLNSLVLSGQVHFFACLVILNIWDLIVMLFGVSVGAHKHLGDDLWSPGGIKIPILCAASSVSIASGIFILYFVFWKASAAPPWAVASFVSIHIVRFGVEISAVRTALLPDAPAHTGIRKKPRSPGASGEPE